MTVKYPDLIYDVGMHQGEDADYYLKKGFRVVGFEANPDLVRHCKNKFSQEIESGRLIIIEGAIIEPGFGETEKQTVKFYKNQELSVWGTVNADWAKRNEILGTHNEIIEVKTIDFTESLKQYGIPHYLKIDIEGSDAVCLKALLDFEQKPDYISVESEKVRFGKLLEEINLLEQLGYTQFKAVQQADIASQTEPNPSKEGVHAAYKFQFGSSGLFGEDLPGRWKKRDEIIRQYKNIFLLYGLFGNNGKLNRFPAGQWLKKMFSRIFQKPVPGWHDTHAKHLSVIL